MHAFHQSVHHVFLKKGRLGDISVMKPADRGVNTHICVDYLRFDVGVVVSTTMIYST